MLKRIIRTLLIFVALMLIAAIFMPDSFKVERSIETPIKSQFLYEQVADFNNWDNWEPWAKMDEAANYTNTGSGIGALREWEGEIIGKGSIEIIELDEPKKVGTTLTFYDPNPMPSYSYWLFEENGDMTKATMGIEGELEYPFGRIFGMFVDFDTQMGADFEKALDGLQVVAMEAEKASMVQDTVIVSADSLAL